MNRLRKSGRTLEESVIEGGATRLRPVLLTAITAWRKHARAALTWSVTAMVPGLVWLLIWLTIHH